MKGSAYHMWVPETHVGYGQIVDRKEYTILGATKLKLSNGIRGSQLEISQWLILCCAKKECAYHKWILETNVGPEQVYPLE